MTPRRRSRDGIGRRWNVPDDRPELVQLGDLTTSHVCRHPRRSLFRRKAIIVVDR